MWPRVVGFAGMFLAAPALLVGQDTDTLRAQLDASLTACTSAIAQGLDAEPATRRAERLWRQAAASTPSAVAVHVGLARVLVQCRLPEAENPSDQLGLFQEAVSILQRALTLEPANWSAHITLGLVFAGAPEFLGRTPDAIAHLEAAVGPNGIPTERPELADALDKLARMYERVGKSDSAASQRRRGARLFPKDSRFASVTDTAITAPDVPTTSQDSALSLASLGTITVVAVSPMVAAVRGGKAMSSLDIVTLPGGTGDLMQALQTLPGVTGGSESSDLAIRGGAPSETSVYLNGARLVYVGSFESIGGSLFGVLDPEVIKTARLHAGGFSAQFGDALSGALEIETVARPASRSWRVAANTAGVAATWKQPLGEATGAWSSLRATDIGALLALQGRTGDYATIPASIQMIAGASGPVGGGDLQVVGLYSHDAAAPLLNLQGYRDGWDSRGTTAALTAGVQANNVGPFLTLRHTVAYSSRTTETAFGVLDLTRRLSRAGFRSDGVAVVGSGILRSGAEVSRLAESMQGTAPTTRWLVPGSPTVELPGEDHTEVLAGGYADVVLPAVAGIIVTPGIRLDWTSTVGRLQLSPRLAASTSVGDFTISVGAGVYRQGNIRLDREDPGLDRRTGHSHRAQHLVLSVERPGRLALRGDLYAKRYDEWSGGDPEWTPARSNVVGMDLFIRSATDRRQAQLGYSLSYGRLTIPGHGKIRSTYDVTHSVTAVVKQRLGSVWEAGSTVRFATGRPYTETLAGASGGSVLGVPNGGRYPSFQRVDARVSRYDRVNQKLIVTFVEVLNLAGRQNAVGFTSGSDGHELDPIRTFFGRRTIVVGVEIR